MTKTTPEVKRHLAKFLAEDIQSGDVTGALLPKGVITARIITRTDTTVAGATYAKTIFEMKKSSAKIAIHDGSKASRNDTIITIRGESRQILQCERTALNLLSRMCGIADTTAKIVSKMPDSVKFYATRKTAPGLRIFDKEAVEAGGGNRHRMSLEDSVMIKDNHIAATMAAIKGSSSKEALEHLIKTAKNRGHKRIEAEVESTQDAIHAARAGATTVMLDNFTPSRIRSATKRLEKEGLRSSVRIEASGGITEKNIMAYAHSGADIISAGYVTNSVIGVDLSLEI